MPMKSVKILLTSCGCPGAAALIRGLHRNGEMRAVIVGTDFDPEAIGRFHCDYFYQVPKADTEYIDKMLEIVDAERPLVLLPEDSREALVLSENAQALRNLNCILLTSRSACVGTCFDKWSMYRYLKDDTDVLFPRQHLVQSLPKFMWALSDLGYPDKRVVFKPQTGSQGQGLRIIDANVDRKWELLGEKPGSPYMSRDEFVSIFSEGSFPDLIVQEHIDGPTECVECLCQEGKLLLALVHTLEDDGPGLTQRGEVINRPVLVETAEEIAASLGLCWCVSMKFIGHKLIDITPRIGNLFFDNQPNLAWLSIKLALGLVEPQEVLGQAEEIRYGMRFRQYIDQVEFEKERPISKPWTAVWKKGAASVSALTEGVTQNGQEEGSDKEGEAEQTPADAGKKEQGD